jgi:polar amino acid transport system substrate-binding protein
MDRRAMLPNARFVCSLAVLSLVQLPARCAEVSVAFGNSLLPFVLAESNSGIEVDIFREALQFRGHTLKPVYVPLARVPHELREGRVDAAQRDGGIALPRFHYGEVSVTYRSAMISLKSRNLKITRPKDIEHLSVFAFQGAALAYPKWLAAVSKKKHYFEVNDQLQQIKTLHARRYDLIVCEENIYKYFARLASEQQIDIKPVNFVYFGKPNAYRPVFRDRAIRDDFNAGLRQLKASGRYRQIIDSYIKAI